MRPRRTGAKEAPPRRRVGNALRHGNGHVRRLAGTDVAVLPTGAVDLVHANYMRIAARGMVEDSGADIEAQRSIARGCIADMGAEAVLLAGTELSLAFDEESCGFRAIDCSRVHLEAILSRSLITGNVPNGAKR